MKDSFFKWWSKLSIWIYKNILYFTYTMLVRKRMKKIERLDIFECKEISNYWKVNYGKKISLKEFGWYKEKRGKVEAKIIPNVIWHSVIEPYFSNLEMEKGFRDKNYFELIIGKDNSPQTILHCINNQLLDDNYRPIDRKKAVELLKKEVEIVCKPSIETGGGRGITFFSPSKYIEKNIEQLEKRYNGNFICQSVVEQCDFLNEFNSHSLNTLRIVSFLFKNNVYILAAFLRIGAGNSRLDNVSSGGCYIQISPEGRLNTYAVIEDLRTHDFIKCKNIQNGVEFANKPIPSWPHIKKIIIDNHYKLSHFGIINWDIAIDANQKPIVIEYNLIDSSPDFHQINIGPIFGDLTDEVLNVLRYK